MGALHHTSAVKLHDDPDQYKGDRQGQTCAACTLYGFPILGQGIIPGTESCDFSDGMLSVQVIGIQAHEHRERQIQQRTAAYQQLKERCIGVEQVCD